MASRAETSSSMTQTIRFSSGMRLLPRADDREDAPVCRANDIGRRCYLPMRARYQSMMAMQRWHALPWCDCNLDLMRSMEEGARRRFDAFAALNRAHSRLAEYR